jgi:hypothetical protein
MLLSVSKSEKIQKARAIVTQFLPEMRRGLFLDWGRLQSISQRGEVLWGGAKQAGRNCVLINLNAQQAFFA